jgi:hypothetical protein
MVGLIWIGLDNGTMNERVESKDWHHIPSPPPLLPFNVNQFYLDVSLSGWETFIYNTVRKSGNQYKSVYKILFLNIRGWYSATKFRKLLIRGLAFRRSSWDISGLALSVPSRIVPRLILNWTLVMPGQNFFPND